VKAPKEEDISVVSCVGYLKDRYEHLGIHSSVWLCGLSSRSTSAAKKLKDMIMSQVNVKSVEFTDKFTKANIVIKPNFKTIGPDFAKEAQNVAKEITETDNSILQEKFKDGKLKLSKWELSVKHLTLERTLPDNYCLGEFNQGNVYLNTDTTEELISEGFYREVLRRIQQARKDSGLQKTDDINLYLKLDKELYHHILSFEDTLKNRVGAKELNLSTDDSNKNFKFESDEQIRGLKFKIMFNVV